MSDESKAFLCGGFAILCLCIVILYNIHAGMQCRKAAIENKLPANEIRLAC